MKLVSGLILLALLLLFTVSPVATAQDFEGSGEEIDLSEAMKNYEEAKKAFEEMGFLDDTTPKEPLIYLGEPEDAIRISFLDDYNPPDVLPLSMLDRTDDGSYEYLPGMFRIRSASYCISYHGYSPDPGDSFLRAPIMGQLGDVVTNILKNVSKSPGIPQENVQELIWGIIGGSTTEDFDENVSSTANQLCSEEDIKKINEVNKEEPIDFMGSELSADFNEELAEALKIAYETLVQLGGDGSTSEFETLMQEGGSFEDLERVAIRPFAGGEKKQFFRPVCGRIIRRNTLSDTFPETYAATTVDISAPAVFVVKHDDEGRVVSIDDGLGRKLEIEYDDSIPALEFFGPVSQGLGWGPVQPMEIGNGSTVMLGDPWLKGYAFKSVKYTHPNYPSSSASVTDKWDNVGWTLCGLPYIDARIKGLAAPRYSDHSEKIDWALNHRYELEILCGSNPLYFSALEIGLLTNGIEDAAGGNPDEEVVTFLKEAWQDALIWTFDLLESAKGTKDGVIFFKRGSKKTGPDGEPNPPDDDATNGDDEDWDEWDDEWDTGDWGRDNGPKVIDLTGGALSGNEGNQNLGTTNNPSEEPDLDAEDEIPDIPPIPPPPYKHPEHAPAEVDKEAHDKWAGDFLGYLDGMHAARVVAGEADASDFEFTSGFDKTSDAFNDNYENGFKHGYDYEMEYINESRTFRDAFGL